MSATAIIEEATALPTPEDQALLEDVKKALDSCFSPVIARSWIIRVLKETVKNGVPTKTADRKKVKKAIEHASYIYNRTAERVGVASMLRERVRGNLYFGLLDADIVSAVTNGLPAKVTPNFVAELHELERTLFHIEQHLFPRIDRRMEREGDSEAPKKAIGRRSHPKKLKAHSTAGPPRGSSAEIPLHPKQSRAKGSGKPSGKGKK